MRIRKKLDERGLISGGKYAPDLIVEILSPGNSKTELRHKFELYESNRVREYWIPHAGTQDIAYSTSLIDGK